MDCEEKGCYIIGLTGASGSGKSAAAKALSGLGAIVIDADEISHSVVDGRAALGELALTFGDWVVGGDGKFDRARVSVRAFSDKEFLARLTGITHKYIIKEIYRRVEEIKRGAVGDGDAAVDGGDTAADDGDAALIDGCGVGGRRRRRGRRVIVIDAPIPVSHGFLDLADEVWVIKAGRAQRLERVMLRDGVSREAAEARFASQLSEGEYEALADVSINNMGDLAELEREIGELYGELYKELR